jgi:hypothetical protein
MTALEPGQARITYPDPGVGDAVVPASAVSHWEGIGWKFAEGDREDPPAEYQRFEGQPVVRIYHPELDRYEVVAESAVPEHRSHGWVLAEDAVAAELEDKTVAELKEEAKARGLPVSGTKEELRERITEYDAQDQAGDEPAQDSEEGEQ